MNKGRCLMILTELESVSVAGVLAVSSVIEGSESQLKTSERGQQSTASPVIGGVKANSPVIGGIVVKLKTNERGQQSSTDDTFFIQVATFGGADRDGSTILADTNSGVSRGAVLSGDSEELGARTIFQDRLARLEEVVMELDVVVQKVCDVRIGAEQAQVAVGDLKGRLERLEEEAGILRDFDVGMIGVKYSRV